MLPNNLNCDMYTLYSINHYVLIEVCLVDFLVACMRTNIGFKGGCLPREASMRAFWSDRQNCSHDVSQKFERIRRFSEKQILENRWGIAIQEARMVVMVFLQASLPAAQVFREMQVFLPNKL